MAFQDEQTCAAMLQIWNANPDMGLIVPGGIHKDKLKHPVEEMPYATIACKQGQPPQFSTGGRYIDYREVTIDIFGVGDVATSTILRPVQNMFSDQPLPLFGSRIVGHMRTEPLEVVVAEQDEVKEGEEYRVARLRWMVWTDRRI